MKDNNKIWTVIEIIRWGTGYFQEKGIDSPRLTIELLLCEILHCDRISLYRNFEKPITKNELVKLKDFIKRRINREPLQFILGKTKFYDVELYVNQSSIIPRPETELLVNNACKIIKDNSQIKKILDIGTGSGCISVSLAKKFPQIKIKAIDINPASLRLAEENAKYNSVKNIVFLEFDILKNSPDEKFDMILSNPPYISQKEYQMLEPEVLNYEPKEALTDDGDGLTFYRRFSEMFKEILNPEAFFLLEIAYNQSDEVLKIFEPKGYNIYFIKDWNNTNRIVVGQLDNK